MTGIFLVALFGAGMITLKWEDIKDIFDAARSKGEIWLKGFKEEPEASETGSGKVIGAGSEKNHTSGFIGRFVITMRDHIRLLLRITLGMGTEKSLKAFLALSLFLGAGAAAALAGKVSALLTMAAAAAAVLFPYGLLRIRLQKLRVQSSREGEILITELLENYKINYFNMQRAIEVTAATIEEAPNSKRLLFNLSKGLNTAETGQIGRLLKEFRLSVSTSWGNILASNMGFALTSGIEVTEAISDLADTVKKARKIDEYARRENNEAFMMFKYLAPVSYFLTVAGGVGFFGLSPEKFLHYQFETEVGLTWFTISLIIYAAGVLVSACTTRTKLDI